jgi:UDP-N-acetylmuramate: L-alanyl-gamma-D-glutamyl-meso-diaminopimelate ligase
MRVHFTGACGRAIGALALELKNREWLVSGSDCPQFGPMDKLLADGGLRIRASFASRNVPAGTDILVAGALIADDNPELKAARRRGIPVTSMAEFLEAHLLKGRRRFVVAGTNGKTTTTTLLSWILEFARKRPDYLFAGLCDHFDLPVRFRGSRLAVLEGDEYWSGSRDPLPKFLHYRPSVLLLTNIQFDHAEIFENLAEIRAHFCKLVEQVPQRSGLIVVSDRCPLAQEVARCGRAAVTVVGSSRSANRRVTQTRLTKNGSAFTFEGQRFQLPLHGAMNVSNAALAIEAARSSGVDLATAAAALAQYRGVRGRLETVLDSPSGTVISDEGYHPAALRENLGALRKRFPKQRLVVAMLTRYTGGRDGFQMRDLPAALSLADQVVLGGPHDVVDYPAGPFSNRVLAKRLRERGTAAHCLTDFARLPIWIQQNWRKGDVLLCSMPPGFDAYATAISSVIQRF